MEDNEIGTPGEPSFNTDAIRSAAHAFADSKPPSTTGAPAPGIPAGVLASEPPAPSPSEVVAAPSQVAKPATPAAAPAAPVEPQVVDLPDHALVRVVVDGKETLRPWKEARTEIMLKAKFTQEMQQLRGKEGQLNEVMTAAQTAFERNQAMEALLTNPEHLAKYIAQQFPGQFTRAEARAAAAVVQANAGITPSASVQQPPATPNFDPSHLSTLGEVDQIAQARVSAVEHALGSRLTNTEKALVGRIEQLLSSVDEKVDAKLKSIQDAEQVSTYNQQIRGAVSELTTQFPFLGVIPNLEGLVRYEVTQLQPRTPDEMLQAIRLVGEGLAENISGAFAETNKQKLVVAAKLATQGIEPPASAPAGSFQRPLTYRNAKGEFSWANLTNAAKSYR